MHDLQLQTPRLLLRRARLEDADDLHAAFSDPEVMRYWSTASHRAIEETRAWVERMVNASPEVCDDFVIEEAGRVIGKAGFWRLPEVGFLLRRDRWGQGLMFEALTAVLGHVFRVRQLEEAIADVDPRNVASLTLLARLGFQERGRRARTICVEGIWCDSVDLVLPRPAAR